MKKILILSFALLTLSLSFDANASRWYCTETWSNGAGTWERNSHCYGTQSACESSCMMGAGCEISCTEAIH